MIGAPGAARIWIATGHADMRKGCCQSNGNLSPFGRTLPYPEPSLDIDRPPLGQGG